MSIVKQIKEAAKVAKRVKTEYVITMQKQHYSEELCAYENIDVEYIIRPQLQMMIVEGYFVPQRLRKTRYKLSNKKMRKFLEKRYKEFKRDFDILSIKKYRH